MDVSKIAKQNQKPMNDTKDSTLKSNDPYANQGGGKLGSGNQNSGHPGNNVTTGKRETITLSGIKARTSDKISTNSNEKQDK